VKFHYILFKFKKYSDMFYKNSSNPKAAQKQFLVFLKTRNQCF